MVDLNTASQGKLPRWARYRYAVPIYFVIVVAVLLALNLPGSVDYVGADNDDTMRLIEVRDLLSGQGWFDLNQYRLGLAGGTLMHWSRLIDLPIATLILFFGTFLAPLKAEAAALLVWPVFLALPLLAAMGLAGWRIGGVQPMHAALGLTAILIVATNRFLPGAIDHHNVQLVLVATIAAMLVDRRYSPVSLSIAGFAAALAIAIGAETMPFIAAVCLIVAALWGWHGEAYRPAAQGFALALSVTVTVAFFATIPPHLYSRVTCDSLSLGFYGITAVGGAALFLAATFASTANRKSRFAVLGLAGTAVLGSALVLAPQCLQNPLSGLDPLLVTFWLDGVSEAKSGMEQMQLEPGTFGGFYAVGFFAAAVCFFRVLRRDRVELHLILLALVAISWGIATVQVRGAVFANLLSMLPLSLLVTELRRNANRDPKNLRAGFVYLAGVLMAVPSVWAVDGVLAAEGTPGLISRISIADGASSRAESKDCNSETALRQLAGLDPVTVAAPSDSGAAILRFTAHRVLAGPYHRNQGGMLTELHIGLAKPSEAEAFLRGAAVGVLAYCASNPQTATLVRTKPDGLYAALKKGRVPPYLEPLPRDENSGLTLYRVKTALR